MSNLFKNNCNSWCYFSFSSINIDLRYWLLNPYLLSTFICKNCGTERVINCQSHTFVKVHSWAVNGHTVKKIDYIVRRLVFLSNKLRTKPTFSQIFFLRELGNTVYSTLEKSLGYVDESVIGTTGRQGRNTTCDFLEFSWWSLSSEMVPPTLAFPSDQLFPSQTRDAVFHFY